MNAVCVDSERIVRQARANSGRPAPGLDMRRTLRNLLQRCRGELELCRRILADRRTPWLTKALLGVAVAYLVSPIDLVPDFIPVLGQLDDLLVVPALVLLALKSVPKPLLQEHRAAITTSRAG